MLHGTHNWLDDDQEMKRERRAIDEFLLEAGIIVEPGGIQP